VAVLAQPQKTKYFTTGPVYCCSRKR